MPCGNIILRFKRKLFIITLSVFVCHALFAQRNSGDPIVLPQMLLQFIPEGYALLDTAKGDLNLDQFEDMIMVLKTIGEDTAFDASNYKRPVLILLGNAGKTFTLAERNDDMLDFYGSAQGQYRPYNRILIKKGLFIIDQDTNGYVTFKYAKKNNDWYLLPEIKEHDPVITKRIKKEFGVVPFKKYTTCFLKNRGIRTFLNYYSKPFDIHIFYPVFEFNNASVTQAINRGVENYFKEDYHGGDTTSIRAILAFQADSNYVRSIIFNDCRNDNRIFSFDFQIDTQGWVMNYDHAYFCFDKTTGSLLTLDSLFFSEKRKYLLQMIKQKQKINLRKFKIRMQTAVERKEFKRDVYDLALKQLKSNSYVSGYNPARFLLYNDCIEVVIDYTTSRANELYELLDDLPRIYIYHNEFKRFVKPRFRNLLRPG